MLSDLTHLEHIRQQMPATTTHIYLNTGTFGPLPDCVTQAMQECIRNEPQLLRPSQQPIATLAAAWPVS